MNSVNPSILQSQLEVERRAVSFDSYDMTIRQIFEMYSEGLIYVPPEYQRQFVWNEQRESELIESIFLGIPVPSLFMATNSDATWEIVDGVQRISSIVHFLGGEDFLDKIDRKNTLKISGLEKLTNFNGLTYNDLPKSFQILFQTRPIRVTVLNDKSDLNVRFDLFERLNTGGVALTNQEIRNCIYRGIFNDQLKKLSKTSDFLSAVKLKDSEYKDGTAEEYVLRFFAYLENREGFEHSVKDFLNNYMRDNAQSKIKSKNLKLFKETMNELAKAFPTGLTRGQASTTSAILYEALAVGVAEAISNGADIDTEKLNNLASDSNLKKLTTGATNSRKMLFGRIDYVRNYLS